MREKKIYIYIYIEKVEKKEEKNNNNGDGSDSTHMELMKQLIATLFDEEVYGGDQGRLIAKEMGKDPLFFDEFMWKIWVICIVSTWIKTNNVITHVYL